MNTEMLKNLKATARELEYSISKISLQINAVCKHGSGQEKSVILQHLKDQKKNLTQDLSATKLEIARCRRSVD